ncbi:hypothetical protein SLEP1_g49823 [Rubroshorea leprosula]|uniref:Uncharacterized protein n=1 Tax=Rubroshorea leprosula TaxID=152421 RepID=A0AAV5LY68_9ROSI|nr:hypothetical protein SLEP1_g49823 [Rubroshorea leprosula]
MGTKDEIPNLTISFLKQSPSSKRKKKLSSSPPSTPHSSKQKSPFLLLEEAQQGAAPGAARHSLGCSRAQPQVHQGAGSGAASEGAQQGLIAFDGCWLK